MAAQTILTSDGAGDITKMDNNNLTPSKESEPDQAIFNEHTKSNRPDNLTSQQKSSFQQQPSLNHIDHRDDSDYQEVTDPELRPDWLKVIGEWTSKGGNSKQGNNDIIKDLTRRGVPSELRPKIWKLLAKAQDVTPQSSEQYKGMLKRTSNCEKLIQRDIDRTYPEIDYFKDEKGPGQKGLFNVIKAYSLHDEEVGYCQGSAFIVGLLLLQLSEEETFILLCRIMQDYRMREIYKPAMAELGLCIYQLECLVQEQLPELYVHFQTQNFYTSMYSSSWFLTLFTSNLPLQLAYRVMDLFLSEGLDIIFRLSIAILQICKEDLLKLDMEGLLKYFQKEMPSRIKCDPSYLIHCANQVKYDSKKMKRLIKDYTTIKNKEQEEAVEFRRLRTENRLLQDRLRNLEAENHHLCDLLIKGQVSRAETNEKNDLINGELRRFKTLTEEQQVKIEELNSKIDHLESLLADKKINYSEEASMVISTLHEELLAAKLRVAENVDEMKDLNKKITEQELYIKSLRENVPADPIAQLQEELSAAKLREAESNSALMELKSKFAELQSIWQEHLQQSRLNNGTSQPNSLDPSAPMSVSNSLQSQSMVNNISGGGSLNGGHGTMNGNGSPATAPVNQQQPSSLSSTLTSSNPISKFFQNSVIKRASGSSSISDSNSNSGGCLQDDVAEMQRIKQDIFTLKLQEASAMAEIKTLRSREMELETLIKIQDNKFRRKEDEFAKIELEMQADKNKIQEISGQLREEQRKLADLELQRKEEQIMNRLKDVEQTRLTGELKQKISSLEIKIEEINTAKRLTESGTEPKDLNEHQERVAELQSESFRLDASTRRLLDMERKNDEREQGFIRGDHLE